MTARADGVPRAPGPGVASGSAATGERGAGYFKGTIAVASTSTSMPGHAS